MVNTLITKKIPIQRINPKILLLYSKPKIGKTEVLSRLDECLTLATEDGVEMYDMIYYRVTSISGDTTHHADGELKGQIKTTSLDNVVQLLVGDAERQIKAGQPLKYPYKFIAIDTIDELEEMCEVSATVLYKNSVIGSTFKGKSVLELPKGNGYYNLRKEVLAKIDLIASMCKYLILVSHVKDKILDKGGIEISSTDISMTGKLGQIICAKADVIGYLYRDGGKDQKLMVSFETYETGGVMGARFPRLAGQKFPFDWAKIYIPE